VQQVAQQVPRLVILPQQVLVLVLVQVLVQVLVLVPLPLQELQQPLLRCSTS
jgi:hypothetical protein